MNDLVRTTLRIPPGLHDVLRELAHDNKGTSINSHIIDRLLAFDNLVATVKRQKKVIKQLEKLAGAL